ncbi:unnamed protein product [Ambrosiozyma monospora]|uniref:Unnamed protein product n=1 Tax=Ambrosiozyma monospora TaxID=43982 RepID=A0ACB5TNB7_AMBMO|nr:unnamed protein product [Ambrosiozyma monospora]
MSNSSIRTNYQLRMLALGLTALILWLHFFTNYSKTTQQKIIDDELIKLNRYETTNSGAGLANPYDPLTTEQRLAKYYPYKKPVERIPKKIYQMWKHEQSHPDFPYKDLGERWQTMNPNYEYLFNTNEKLIDFLKDEFQHTVPEITMALEMLPTLILKSDFSRYLMVFLTGGMYGDLDTYLRWPVDQWWDSNRNVGFVAGIEADYNIHDWSNYMQRRLQFEQWFFKSQPHHPILRKLISTIVKTTFQARREEKLRPYYKDFEDVDRCQAIDIMDWTGPGVFTDVIYAYLNSLKNPTVVDINVKRSCSHFDMTGPDRLGW